MQHSNKKVLWSVVVAANLILTSCAGSSDDKKPSQDVIGDVAGYSEASCKYKYSEGPAAPAKAAPSIETSFFGKRLDTSLLKPVLAASGSEVVRFAESNNVRYYKTKAKSAQGCMMAASLPQAPYDIENEFSRVDGGDGSILGLYLGLKTPDLYSTNYQAVITVREDTNKWILVHEYMHHLFQIQAVADGIDVSGLKASVKKKSDDYQTATTNLSYSYGTDRTSKVKDAAVKLQLLQADFLVLIKQYYLEEMTIESTLGEKLANGQLKLVLDKQRLNGAAYTISSAKKSQDLIDILKNETSTFTSKYSSDLIGTAEVSQLSALSSQMDNMKYEMSSLSAKAKSYLNSKGFDFKGMRSFMTQTGEQKESHIGCSHGELPADVIESITSLQK